MSLLLVLNSSIEKGYLITQVQLLMLNTKFMNIMCLYCNANLVSTKYVLSYDMVGKRVFKVAMYQKHVRHAKC